VFAQFWDTYPRKVGKAAARRGWLMMRRRGDNPQQVIAAAERFRDECRARGTAKEYIPHPSRWLGDGRYADETEDVSQPAPQMTRPQPIVPPYAVPPSDHLNREQLIAAVVRLGGDQESPLTAAAEIVALVTRNLSSVPPGMIPVTPERGVDLAQMPYREYLESPEWKARRLMALQGAFFRCQICNRDSRLNVHHRTYERRGVEHPADLVVLCEDCHGLYHGKGRLAEPAALTS
jgi:hypothetical protein